MTDVFVDRRLEIGIEDTALRDDGLGGLDAFALAAAGG